MALRLKQPQCGGCGACGGTPTIGTITCVSRQGNGYLRGWSKFENEDAGDWNQRKFTRFTKNGSGTSCSGHVTGSCTDNVPCSGADTSEDRRCYKSTSGVQTFDPVTNTGSGSWTIDGWFWNRATHGTGTGCDNVPSCGQTSPPITYDGVGGPWDTGEGFEIYRPSERGVGACVSGCAIVHGVDVLYQVDAGHYVTTCLRTLTATDTHRLATSPGCGGFAATCGGTVTAAYATGTFEETLTDPDTVNAALARGSVSPGTSCRTSAGTIGSTIARDTTQITVTGPTSAVATIPITGLTASTAYIVTVKVNRYTAGGGSYVDFVYDTIEFTAGATTEDIEYDVPVNTDYDYEIDTSYKDIAAA